ncbi:MAG: Zn-finger nucleic acid-binding protein/uncharacterized protein YxjI [Gammaproteobacteria bacterium]|jgi:Zn-finger nucleic acid-binding protein/uncharacterized protein YxjI
MSLKCPDCKNSLKSVHYEGVRVHLCMSCKGFFLKPKELKQIQETQELEVSMDMTPPSRSGDKILRMCPSCDTGMAKRKYGKVSSTIIDLCEKCKGIWLDKGELERIQLDYEVVQQNRSGEKAKPKTSSAVNSAVVAAIIQCPKCSHEQAEAEECSKCGIIFAKFTAAQREVSGLEDAEQRNRDQTSDVLKSIKGVEIQQTRDLVEAFISFERKNHYSLRMIGHNDTWHAHESGGGGLGWVWRNLFGRFHRTEIEIADPQKNLVMRIERRVRFFFGQCELYSRDGKKLGSVSRTFAPFNRWFVIKNALGKAVMRIKGPVFSPWTFIIFRGDREIARIQKKWSGWFTEWLSDADRYSLRFNTVTDSNTKLLLLGSAFLIDHVYFENYGQKENLMFRTWRSSPLLVGIVLALILFVAGGTNIAGLIKPLQPETPPVLAGTQRSSNVQASRTVEFKTLLDRKQTFDRLAKDGYYTVVEVYMDSCSLCRKLETGFKPLLTKRQDVYIRRVHYPEGGLQFSFEGSSQTEMDAQVAETNELMQSYSFCGTPHVLVFGPDKNALAADSCKSRDGTRFLQSWINTETGSLPDLLEGITRL